MTLNVVPIHSFLAAAKCDFLSQHIKTGSFIFCIVNAKLEQKCDLITHHRVNTEDKPYVCDTCDKGFIHKNKLKIH